MYVIMSNNGPWEFGMIGAVGAVATPEEFLPFVEKHVAETDGDLVPGDEIVVYKGARKVAQLLEEHEMSFFADGSDKQIALVEDPDCYPAIYVLVKFS